MHSLTCSLTGVFSACLNDRHTHSLTHFPYRQELKVASTTACAWNTAKELKRHPLSRSSKIIRDDTEEIDLCVVYICRVCVVCVAVDKEQGEEQLTSMEEQSVYCENARK